MNKVWGRVYEAESKALGILLDGMELNWPLADVQEIEDYVTQRTGNIRRTVDSGLDEDLNLF